MSTTGERLRIQRKRQEISADEVAIELGVSRSTIFRYENGYIEKVPSNILEKLADILYTTPAYLAGWTDDYHDWERIGNDQGIYPPNDYDGSYEDYVKYKIVQESDDLCDSYWDLYDNAIEYLKSLGCKIIETTAGNTIQVITPVNEKLEVSISDLVSNFMIYGSSKPGIKKLLLQKTDFNNLREDERHLLMHYNLLNYEGKTEARKRVEELSMLSIYTAPKPLLNAAHERTDCELTAEGQEHDDEIMKDDSEWK